MTPSGKRTLVGLLLMAPFTMALLGGLTYITVIMWPTSLIILILAGVAAATVVAFVAGLARVID